MRARRVAVLALALSAAPAFAIAQKLDDAVRLYDDGDFEGAVHAFGAAVEHSPAGPERARALFHLGLGLVALQNDSDARSAFARAFSDDPDVQPDRRRIPPAVLEMFDAVRAGLTAPLRIRTAPGAAVTLDGAPLGTTPFDGPVAIGRHRIEVRTPDRLHELQPIELVLFPGREAVIEGELVLRKGTLTLTSVPPGASIVTADDRPLGNTPLVGLRLPAGRLTVRAELPPRPTLFSELLIDPDVPSAVELTLPPPPPTPWYARASSWGWVTAVAAVGLGVGGGVFAYRAVDDSDTIDQRARDGDLNYDEWDRLGTSAQDHAALANLLFVSAGAAALGSAAFFVFGEE